MTIRSYSLRLKDEFCVFGFLDNALSRAFEGSGNLICPGNSTKDKSGQWMVKCGHRQYTLHLVKFRNLDMSDHPFSQDDAVIVPYFLGVLYRELISDGYRANDLLQGTGFSTDMFERDDLRLSFTQLRQFLVNAEKLSGNPELGVRLGKSLTVTSLGVFGLALLSSPDLMALRETYLNYFQIQSSMLKVSTLLEDDKVAVQVDESIPSGDIYYFMMSGAITGMNKMLSLFLNEESIDTFATLACPRPDIWPEGGIDYGMPVEFDQPYTRFYFPIEYLSRPVPTSNPRTAKLSTEICERILHETRQEAAILTQVRQHMLQAGSYPSLDQTADALAMSPRTLRRELQKQNTSFQRLSDQLKQDIAVKYLTTTDKSNYEIAVLCGYEDLSNFTRAFKRWTGRTPGSYRRATAVG